MISRIPIIVAAALLSVWFPAQALATAPDPSLRPVAITAPAGTIAARVSPIPVLITDARQTGGHIRVDNTSALNEAVTIAAVDYTIDQTGKPVPAAAGFAFGSASWYRFETPAFALPAGMGREIPFDLTIPVDAAAGDHFAALNVTVTAEPGQVASTGGASARSVLVFQTRLQHRIDGAVPQTPTLRLSASADSSLVHFTAHVGNPGNTVLGHQADPTPTLTLYDTSPWGNPGQPERTIGVGGFYVAPQSVRDVSVDWSDLPIVGQYRAVFTLPAADGQPQVTAETTVTIVNAPALVTIGGGAGGALLLIGALLLGRSRRRRMQASTAAATVRDLDEAVRGARGDWSTAADSRKSAPSS